VTAVVGGLAQSTFCGAAAMTLSWSLERPDPDRTPQGGSVTRTMNGPAWVQGTDQ